jgi:DNA-binding MarR family transcriptional regulator
LERQPDPEDRRGSYAALTTAGEQALRSAWPYYAAAIEQYFGRFLTDEEAQTLFRIFTQMAEGKDVSS